MSSLSFRIDSTDYTSGIELEVWVDQDCIRRGPIENSADVVCDFSDDEGQHKLSIRMTGKTPEHTQVDSDGNITRDVMLSVNNFSLDGISVDQVVFELMVYQHNFNGNGDVIKDKFYGDIGCNGELSLEFTTPVYLWLLENM